MKVHGREIGFLRTVKTTCDLAELCPDKDIEKLQVLLDGDIATAQKTAASLIQFLNEGYEMSRHFEDPQYKPHPLTKDEILYLDEETYKALFEEAVQAFMAGAAQTVEVEPTKSKKKTG